MMTQTITQYPHTDSKPLDRFCYWVKERESIRIKKEAGRKPPFTTNPILRKFRFCNTQREHDRVTRWIAKHWRDASNVHVWHAMIIARFINWPPTLEYCGNPEPWPHGSVKFARKLKQLEADGARIWTGAYIVSTNGATGSKVDHVLRLFERAWKELHPNITDHRSCEAMYRVLMSVNGIGSFMAAQVVADLKYTAMLENAPDWMDFVAPGPGSQRGLNRLLGCPLAAQWNNKEFAMHLQKLRTDAAKVYKPIGKFHLQDIQNQMCEFDKYERVLHAQGKPRSQYRPSPDPMP